MDRTKTDAAPPETITIEEEIWTADDIRELMRSRDTYGIWKREGDERITELESLLSEWALWHKQVYGAAGYSADSLPVRTLKRLEARYPFSRHKP